jgi:hypothetical protein
VRLSDSAQVRDEALKLEAESYVKSLIDNKANGGFLSKRAKLNVNRKLGFRGKIFIDLTDNATERATTVFKENTDKRHLIFFVDGSRFIITEAESGSVVTYSGAAVVYKPLEPNQPWVERYFAPSECEQNIVRVELVAILDGLKVAAVDTDLFERCDRRDSDDAGAKIRVKILSDCTSALRILKKLQGAIAADSPLLGDRIVRELIAMSQYLHRKGVEVELHWVRGHANVQGNSIANYAARYAAKHPEISAILEKELQVKLEPLPRAKKARTSPQNKPSAKEEKKKKTKKKSTHCEAAMPTIIPEVQDHIL